MSERLNLDNSSASENQENPLRSEWVFDSLDAGAPAENINNASEAEQNIESAAERFERIKKELARASADAYTLDQIKAKKQELQEVLEDLKKEQSELDSATPGETISEEEARRTLEKAKKNGGIKGHLTKKVVLIIAMVLVALTATVGGIVASLHSTNNAAPSQPTYAATEQYNPGGVDETQPTSATEEVSPSELDEINEADEVHDYFNATGGVDYNNDGIRDSNTAGTEIQWESQMDKLDEARHFDRETAWNFFDGSKMLSGGLGARPIGLELMDEQRNFGEGSLEAWSVNTLDATRNNMPSTIMGELIMHGTVMGDKIVNEDGTIEPLSSYLDMLERADDEFTGKYQNQVAQDQYERFNNGTVIAGRTPNQYYSVQIAIDKTSEDVRMEVVIVDTDKLQGEDLQNEARQWVDIRQEDGKLFFDDSEELERYIVAYLGLPEGTKLEVHSDNSGGNQICAWVIDETAEQPGPQEQPVTPVNPDTGSEGTGTENEGTGTENEGTGTEGEGTGSEDTGSESTGTENESTGTENEGTGDEGWGKSGDPHAGENVDVSDQVDPASEVSRGQNDNTNRGNEGYTPGGSNSTPGSASGNNNNGDRISGGSNQGGNGTNGTNPNSNPTTTTEGQNRDATGNNNQENAHTSGGETGTGATTGGNNYSDAGEEEAIANGDF